MSSFLLTLMRRFRLTLKTQPALMCLPVIQQPKEDLSSSGSASEDHEKSRQSKFQLDSLASPQSPSQTQPQTQQTEPQLAKQQFQTTSVQHQHSKPLLVQNQPEIPSVLDEAAQVLRQVRRQKVIFEENLESLQRVKSGETLQCQLEAMAANR